MFVGGIGGAGAGTLGGEVERGSSAVIVVAACCCACWLLAKFWLDLYILDKLDYFFRPFLDVDQNKVNYFQAVF